MSDFQGHFGKDNQGDYSQGKYGELQREDLNASWICPNCETVNIEEVCFLCGYQNVARDKDGENRRRFKKFYAIISVFVLVILGYFSIHFYSDPTCTEGAVCVICGKKGGEAALGHEWKAATCTEPKTCIRCAKTSGSELGHEWKAATCIAPKVCTVCHKIMGKKAGHQWVDATYDLPKTCSECGRTEGNVKGYIGAVTGRYTGERFYRSGRYTSYYTLYKKIENCRKFTINYSITKVNKGNPYGRFEIFVRVGKNDWEWKSLGVVTISKAEVQIPLELDPGISFDAVAVVCGSSGNYSYSSRMNIYDVQVYNE